jgi:hypothetical protein
MFVTNNGSLFRHQRLSEAQYESIVLQMAPHLFPEWDSYRWKHRVYTPDGRGAEPDMILLSKDSFEWAVVEVELDHHSVSGHIDDQLERLSAAVYGYGLIDTLTARGVAAHEAREYLSRKPAMLCVVDGGSPRIKDCCNAHGFDMAVMIPYANEVTEPALHVHSVPGQYRPKRTVPVVDFSFRLSADNFLGKTPLVVPEEFPSLENFTLREGAEETHVKVVHLLGSRLIFLPQGLKMSAAGGLKISAIDIDRAVFELRKD